MGSTTSRADANASSPAPQPTEPSGDTPAGPRPPAGGIRSFLRQHRRRLARAAGILIVAAAASTLLPRVPRTANLQFALGPDHSDVLELRVAYVQQGEVYKGVRFDFPAGAPEQVRHEVSLPSGDFEVWVDLTRRGNSTARVVRSLQSPVEGRLRLNVGLGDAR